MRLELVRVRRLQTKDPRVVSFEIPLSRANEYAEFVRKGQELDRYDVRIETPRSRRSTGYKSQNHHLNGHCMQIAHETGQDFETVKLYVKRMAIARGLPLKLRPDGEILYSIVDNQPMPISETEMDTQQCGWCIEEAHILAADFGIILREE
jgi:hypothetical protein